jgi:hypothetical protein
MPSTGTRARAAIEEAVDEMQIAGSAAPRTDRELSGQVRLGAGGEGSGLLVSHMQPLDLALPADRVGEAVEAVADDTVDALDAGRGEGFDELISDGLHGLAPR